MAEPVAESENVVNNKRTPFKFLTHATHYPEVTQIIQDIEGNNCQVVFRPSPVGKHHGEIFRRFGQLSAVWFGVRSTVADQSDYEGFDPNSKYGPFQFSIRVDHVFASFADACGIGVPELRFHSVEETYPREISRIVIVSTNLEGADENLPFIHNDIEWAWQPNLQNEDNIYENLEFMFVFPDDVSEMKFQSCYNEPDGACVIEPNHHEKSKRCVPYIRWSEERRERYSLRSSDHKIGVSSYNAIRRKHPDLGVVFGWTEMFQRACNNGWCSQPGYHTDGHAWTQSFEYAQTILNEMFPNIPQN